MQEGNRSNGNVDPLLTVKDVANRLRVSTRTVWRFIANGELRTVRIGKRIVRIRLSDLKRFLK